MISRGLLLVLALTFPAAIFARGDCSVADISGAKTPMERRLLAAMGRGWMTHARVCKMGPYTVAVPAGSGSAKDAPLMVMLDGRPVFERSAEDAIVFDPSSLNAIWDRPLVSVRTDASGKRIERLWYQTVPDRNGEYWEVYDLDFDGHADERVLWKGERIKEWFVRRRGGWHRLDLSGEPVKRKPSVEPPADAKR